ncbi:MAG: FAD-dependent oxidoreductase, partial [Candidatus Limnocylindrus sp.]
VVGGGISGLTCALELRRAGADVVLVERDAVCGGQSRSELVDGVHLCYSWRVFTTNYRNLLEIFSSIPTQTGGTVRDSLLPTGPYLTGASGETFLTLFGILLFDAPPELDAAERARIVERFVTLLGLCDERLHALEHMSFFDFIAPQGPFAAAYIDHIVGPFLGLEPRGASVLCVVQMMQAVYANTKGLVPNAPYNVAIFDPWVAHLRALGVEVRTSTAVDRVAAHAVLLDTGEILEADRIALCVDQWALARLAHATPALGLHTAAEFAAKASQLYYSFELLLPMPVANLDLSIFAVKEVPWLPIVERWQNFFADARHVPGDAAEQWNVAIVDGIPYEGRTLAQTPPELAVEFTLRQMRESSMLRDLRLVDGTPLWSAPLHVRAWPYWRMDNGTLRNTQDQYKICFNTGCFALAPPMRTGLPSVFVGSVVARHLPIVSQEAACYNGRAAARAMLGGSGVPLRSPPALLPLPPPVRVLDRALLALGLPYLTLTERTFVLLNALLLAALLLAAETARRRLPSRLR